MSSRLALIVAAILLAALPVSSQTPTIGVYRDADGGHCNLIDSPGTIEVYVIASSAAGVRAVDFTAPRPDCFDATYIRDDLVYPLALGNSQTGISIPVTGCQASVHVLTIVYYSNNNTGPCCSYPIAPHPGFPSGEIEVVNCDYEIDYAVGLDHTINGDASCFCGIDPPPSVPSNPEPKDGFSTHVYGSLSWSSHDPDGDPVTFDIYLGTDPDPPLVAVDHPDTAYTPDILEFGADYYWRVVARDDKGMESSGPVWQFGTDRWSEAQLVVTAAADHCELTANDTVVVDVDLVDTAIPIDDGGLDLTYDPAMLTPIGCDPGDLITGWAQFDWEVVGASVRVSAADVAAIPPGTGGTFARVRFLSTCCNAESTTVTPLCPDSVTGDLRSLYRECSEYSCGVYTADGDVNGDDSVTPGDALCALESYLSFPAPPPSGCAGLGWDVRSDVDCGGTVTPADALCIFRSWLDASCSFCSGAPAPMAVGHDGRPAVTLDVVEENDGGWTAIVSAGGVAGVDAFGLDVRFDRSRLEVTAVSPRGVTVDFDAFQSGEVEAGWLRVGAYSADAARTNGGDLLALRFAPVAGATGGAVTVTGFVDALEGAGDVVVALGTESPSEPLPSRYALHQNHPNPFNPETTIRYEIPAGERAVPVNLAVYSVDGRRVAVLENTPRDGGVWTVTWDGSEVASGVYFCVLRAGPETLTRKMVVLK